MDKYIVLNKSEETECDYCGYPLFVDDTAIMDYDTLKVYCSETCAKLDNVTVELSTRGQIIA